MERSFKLSPYSFPRGNELSAMKTDNNHISTLLEIFLITFRSRQLFLVCIV